MIHRRGFLGVAGLAAAWPALAAPSQAPGVVVNDVRSTIARGPRLYLAHTDKAAAFRRYADYYRSTSGQVYWADEQQMSIYPDGYHAAVDLRTTARAPATEAITEIYCERDALPRFMADVREDALRYGFDIIYGTVRLIERDDQCFFAWAKKPYACVVFNLHVVHPPEGIRRARGRIQTPDRHRHSLWRQLFFRRTTGTRRKGSSRRAIRFAEFLKLKRRYDPGEVFQSDWYRHYRGLFA